jgi:hypothetical protein
MKSEEVTSGNFTELTAAVGVATEFATADFV